MYSYIKYPLNIFITSILLLASCTTSINNEQKEQNNSFLLPDTLVIGTLYSPTSYFIYRDETLGFDYRLIKSFCDEKNIVMDIVVAPGLESLVEMLDSGQIDIAAYEIPITAEYKQ